MHLIYALLAVLVVFHSSRAASPAKRSYDTHDYYVLEHSPQTANSVSLDDVANALHVEVVEQAGELCDHWLVRASKSSQDLSARAEISDHVLDTFENLRASADSHIAIRSAESAHARSIVSSVKFLERQNLYRLVKRAPPIRPPLPTSSKGILERLGIRDPLFPDQWHLVNDDYPEHMMNVTPVWEMGLTGKGIISSFIDDGLDYTSDDLSANFDADDSYDFNDHEKLPTPKNWNDHHGTRCAGQVAAQKNTVCGIGIAYESKVAGVRILGGHITNVDEAAALNYGFQNVSIYSCSWGPRDNGQTMEAPGYLIKKAVVNGINNGRGGKGSIFVFASGNGGGYGDQCNFDGYTNSIYSVTVSSVDYKGLHPYYSESCAANMIVAYSSGGGRHIVTTDKGKNECSTTHGGTSAAAPNAVGVFALALEARPDLTWRDIQYLCIETARVINPDDPDWDRMASGKLYSYKYGFGAIDAYRYVNAAQDWKLVKPQAWFNTKTVQIEGGTYKDKKYTGGQFIGAEGVKSTLSITTDTLQENNFEALEHITIKVWINHSRRGDVEVEIVSPSGVKSILASSRGSDEATTGYPGWTFMTVKHWGENPVGDWTIKVSDQNNPSVNNGTFLGWNMIFWGSTIDPAKAQKYEVPVVEDVLPPSDAPSRPVLPIATTTQQHSHPTAELPTDHGIAEGENSHHAFSSGANSPTATATSPVTEDDLLSNVTGLISSQRWSFAAFGALVMFGIGVTIFVCRRRATRRRLEAFNAMGDGDNVRMSALSRGRMPTAGLPTNRDLYGVGEASDDEDADENTGLRAGARPPGRSTAGLGFHSGFLDDDELSTAGASTAPPKYTDEPFESQQQLHDIQRREGETGS